MQFIKSSAVQYNVSHISVEQVLLKLIGSLSQFYIILMYTARLQSVMCVDCPKWMKSKHSYCGLYKITKNHQYTYSNKFKFYLA